LLDAEGHVEQVISSFIDVTSVKSAELATRENEAKSRFLASMSHELRTPLNSILGFAQLLEQRSFGELNERQTRYVGHITSSGQHLLELVNDILDLSKVAAGQMDLNIENVPIESTVNEVLARLRPMADGRRLSVTSAVVPGLVARADRRRVEQVLFNLLSNAIKFTPEHGSVGVEARSRAGHVLISVRDTGVGIPEDQHARVFEEFTQVEDGRNRRHEGTGLGLPLSKRLVELMSGRLTLRSEPGRGSEFSFTLPLA
jgi:signal transduction histidine kinase